ncbi:MAG: acyl-CoA reductase, partial [Ramlibacter sp.]|nr:acyl-CoA reductase [Ramlibacter sp.]
MTTLHAVAGYLPGLAADALQWQTLKFGSGSTRLDVSVPVLTGVQMTALAQRVKQASRLHLKTMEVSRIIAVIDSAIARLLDPADPYRQEAERLLPTVTGYDAEMVRLGLTAFFKTFRAPQLQRFVAEDFGNPKLLDQFQPRPKGGVAMAFGPELLVHIWAGNVPALP